jgi:hypothetical protein
MMCGLIRADSVLCDGSRCAFVASPVTLGGCEPYLAAVESLRFLPLFRAALDGMR